MSSPAHTDDPATAPLRIGDWRVDPATGVLSRGDENLRLEARTLRLLLRLAARAGEVVSIDELLNQVWAGVIVTPDSVYQAVTSLRRQLGDDPKRPAYIATVPRLGYRMVASVAPWMEPTPAEPAPLPQGAVAAPAQIKTTTPAARRRSGAALRASTLLILVLALVSVISIKLANRQADAGAARTRMSVAVLPFLDLTTQAMNEEYFADGMTEELIDQLSKQPGWQVPSATSSFYFKDKQLPVPEIAKQLGVAYVIDGSIRKSDATLRVTARLVRADDGYVVWNESYDRPLNATTRSDVLTIQQEVAIAMTKSLQSSAGTAGPTAAAPADHR